MCVFLTYNLFIIYKLYFLRYRNSLKLNVIFYDHIISRKSPKFEPGQSVDDVQWRFIIRLASVRRGEGGRRKLGQKKENSTRTGGNEMQLSLCCAFDPEVD